MISPILIVTGSSGLIGVKTVEAFASDFRVFALDVKPPRGVPKGAEFLRCDFTRDDDVKQAFDQIAAREQGDPVASVIHLAAYYDFSGAPSPLYRELTVEGTRRLLRALRDFPVEQLIFSSSLLVMKPAENEHETITEASPVEPTWDYPNSKIEAEEVIRGERGSIRALILRIAGVYDDTGHSLPIAQQIYRIYEKTFESYFFPGDKSHGQPFVHLDDLVACFRQAVERRARLGPEETLLIAEPDLMTYAELQEQLGELIHGKEWPTIRIPAPVAKVGAWAKEKIAGSEETFIKPWMIDLADAHYPVSIGRAHARLEWQPRRTLRDTLPTIIGHLKQDPRKWYAEHKLPWPEEAPPPAEGGKPKAKREV